MTLSGIARSALTGAALVAGATITAAAPAAEPTVIHLTQTGCQFVESENGVDHGYKTSKAADCEAINAKSGAERLATAKVMTLKPGTYRFVVENRNVPYELGFWLREHDYSWKNPLHKLTKTSISGGGLTQGKSRTYDVELKPGEYFYSCPLNPTPNYKLVVAD